MVSRDIVLRLDKDGYGQGGEKEEGDDDDDEVVVEEEEEEEISWLTLCSLSSPRPSYSGCKMHADASIKHLPLVAAVPESCVRSCRGFKVGDFRRLSRAAWSSGVWPGVGQDEGGWPHGVEIRGTRRVSRPP